MALNLKDKFKKLGGKARTAKQKAALKAAQLASAAKRKGKRALGKAESKGGRVGRAIKKAGLSQRSTTGGRGGRSGASNRSMRRGNATGGRGGRSGAGSRTTGVARGNLTRRVGAAGSARRRAYLRRGK